MSKILKNFKNQKVVTILAVTTIILFISNITLTAVLLSKIKTINELEDASGEEQVDLNNEDKKTKNSKDDININEPTSLFKDTEPEENQHKQNSENTITKTVDFQKELKDGKVRWKSELLEITVPQDWSVEANYKENEEKVKDVNSIKITSSSNNSYNLQEAIAFGITRSVPVTFNEKIPNLYLYSSIATPESDLQILKNSYNSELDCSIKEEKVFCKADKNKFVDFKESRYVKLSNEILILNKEPNSETYVLTDGIFIEFNDQLYFEDLIGDWSIKELETLIENLKTLELK